MKTRMLIVGLTAATMIACAFITTSAVQASMASLGGISSASLWANARNSVTKACPAVVDDFNVTNQVLNGKVLSSSQGQTWTAPTAFTVNGSKGAVTGTPPPAATALAVIPWQTVNTSLSATVTLSGSFTAGLALHADPGTNSAIVLQLASSGTNRTRLVKIANGVATNLKTTNLNPSTGVWKLTYESGVYSVYQGATKLFSYPSTTAEQTAWSAEQATWEARTKLGLYASGAQPNTRWDDVGVTCL